MSYILDALRKAESERERDASTMAASLSGAATPATASATLMHRLLPGLAVGLGLGLAGLLAWHWLTPTPPPTVHAEQGMAMPPPSPPQTQAQAPDAWPPQDSVTPPARPTVVQVPAPAPSSRARATRPGAHMEPSSTRNSQDTVIEMPEEVRRNLPPLSFGGAMYSDKPSSRMLVINGRVFHEGDAIAPGLTLETIQLKSAVLRVQGQRYLITY